MATKDAGRLREITHLSFSSRDTLLRCAKSFFLQKIANAPRWPALWLAGGSAVHEVTETYDLLATNPGGLEAHPFNAESVWNNAFNAQLAKLDEKEPNRHAWRQSKYEPVEVWREQGLQFVQAYIDWRVRSPWDIWTTPDGEPAIELDVSGMLPGCPVEIKTYLDRVFHDPVFDRLAIVDLKTGKRPPKTADQFGVYRALLKAKYGVDADMGVPFMNRKATLGKVFDLTEYTPEMVGGLFAEAWEQIQSGEFPADTSDCFICDVQNACFAKNGPLAKLYDPDHPEHPDHPYPF